MRGVTPHQHQAQIFIIKCSNSFFFFKEFQLIASVSDDNYLSLNQYINYFLMQTRIESRISYLTITLLQYIKIEAQSQIQIIYIKIKSKKSSINNLNQILISLQSCIKCHLLSILKKKKCHLLSYNFMLNVYFLNIMWNA